MSYSAVYEVDTGSVWQTGEGSYNVVVTVTVTTPNGDTISRRIECATESVEELATATARSLVEDDQNVRAAAAALPQGPQPITL